MLFVLASIRGGIEVPHTALQGEGHCDGNNLVFLTGHIGLNIHKHVLGVAFALFPEARSFRVEARSASLVA